MDSRIGPNTAVGNGTIVSVEFEVFGQVQGRLYGMMEWDDPIITRRITPTDPTVRIHAENLIADLCTGCYFTKYCKEMCDQRSVGGWVKNSKNRTILGKLQGTKNNVDDVVQWLGKTGSPGCRIEKVELSNWEFLAKQEIRSFSIRF